MTRLSAGILLLATLVVCATSAASVGATSPSALLASILAAGRAERSVHYTSVARLGGRRIVQVADVGSTSGIQRITFGMGGRTGHVTVLVSSATAYFRGDAFVLVNYMGLHAAAAAKYSNAWILVPRADRLYGAVAADVTLASAISSLAQPGRPQSAAGRTIGGQRTLAVKWRSVVGGEPVTTTLYARAVGSPLPVEETAVRGADSVRVSFSRWNEPIRIDVPKSTVPISQTGLE